MNDEGDESHLSRLPGEGHLVSSQRLCMFQTLLCSGKCCLLGYQDGVWDSGCGNALTTSPQPFWKVGCPLKLVNRR